MVSEHSETFIGEKTQLQHGIWLGILGARPDESKMGWVATAMSGQFWASTDNAHEKRSIGSKRDVMRGNGSDGGAAIRIQSDTGTLHETRLLSW